MNLSTQRTTKYWLCLLFLNGFLLFNSSQIFTQLVLTQEIETYNLGQHLELLEDQSSSLTIDHIQDSNDFIEHSSPFLSLGHSNSSFWLKIPLENNAIRSDYMLTVSNSGLDEVDLYYPSEEGNYKLKKSGDKRPYRSRDFLTNSPTFKLNLTPNKEHHLYLRLKSGQAIRTTVILNSELAHMTQLTAANYNNRLNLGLVLGRFIFHLALLFFFFGNAKFRAFSFFGLVACMMFVSGTGGVVSLFSDSPYLANLGGYLPYSLIITSFCYFVYVTFEVPKYFPKLKMIFWIFGLSGILFLSINLFVNLAQVTLAFEYINLLMEAFIISFICYAYAKGARPSIWYVLPILLYIIPNFLFMLRFIGIHIPGIVPIFIFLIRAEMLFVYLLIAIMLKEAYSEAMTASNALISAKIEREKRVELDQAKSNFFANVTHEFRTPLTLLASPLDDLIKKSPSNDLLKIMRRNVNRLLSLVEELLDLSKLDESRMNLHTEVTQSRPFFNGILNSFNSLADQKNIRYATEVNVPMEIIIDQDKIEKILNNLLSNAIKFTLDGGKIKASVNCLDNKSLLQLRVSDNGIGLRGEEKEKVFDRFYQIENSTTNYTTGTGIGLAITKKLTELMGGTVSLESEHGAGSTFLINIPLSHNESKSNSKTQSRRSTNYTIQQLKSEVENNIEHQPIKEQFSNLTSDKPRLLIIEDEPDIRALIKRILSDNFQIVMAQDGEEGVEKAKASNYDIIILDLMMPKKDGYQVLNELRNNQSTSHLPIIMLTAKSDSESRIAGLEHGADVYITKPFISEELRAQSLGLIHQRKQLHQKFSKSGSFVKILDSDTNTLLKPDREFIDKIDSIVGENVSNELFGVEQLAHQMGISRAHLYRKVKGLINMTPTDLIKNYRLDQASMMINSNKDSVKEIAFAVGFSSHSYFSTEFKKRFGKSPSELHNS